MNSRCYFICLLVGSVVGDYQEAWTNTRDEIVSAERQGMVGVNMKARPDIVESVTHTRPLQCDKNTKSIAPSRINDNYCDCLIDGLDEPSTSACSGVSKEPQFWCHNNGVSSHYLPSSKVNDGICDCCDGSDERFIVGDIKCSNTCNDAHQAEKDRLVELKLGLKKKQTLESDMVNEMIRLKEDNQDRTEEIHRMNTAIWQLKLHEENVLANERRIRRYDIFDNWSGKDATQVCIRAREDDTIEDDACAILQVSSIHACILYVYIILIH
jgi:hypothetical protein